MTFVLPKQSSVIRLMTVWQHIDFTLVHSHITDHHQPPGSQRRPQRVPHHPSQLRAAKLFTFQFLAKCTVHRSKSLIAMALPVYTILQLPNPIDPRRHRESCRLHSREPRYPIWWHYMTCCSRFNHSGFSFLSAAQRCTIFSDPPCMQQASQQLLTGILA